MEHLLQLREQNVPKWDHLLGGILKIENDRPPKSSRPGREFSPIGAKINTIWEQETSRTTFAHQANRKEELHVAHVDMWMQWIRYRVNLIGSWADKLFHKPIFLFFLRWINLRWIEMHWSKCFFSLFFFRHALYGYTAILLYNRNHPEFEVAPDVLQTYMPPVVYWYNSPLHPNHSHFGVVFAEGPNADATLSPKDTKKRWPRKRRFTFPRFVVSSFRLYRLPFCLRTREACLISMTWRSGEQLFQLLGCQEAGEYIYIYSDIWFLWLWQWHVKSWLGSKIAHDMSKNKSVAWRVGSFTKFDRRNHNRLLQRRLPPSQNKVNLRDFRKLLIKNMFFLWFYTPPETNMESENHPSEKELHLPNLQRFHVCFPGCRESS